jgi:hypothetical protein
MLGLTAGTAAAELFKRLQSLPDEELLRLSPLPPAPPPEPEDKRPKAPIELARTVWGPQWKDAPHLDLLNRKLVDVANKRLRRLLITMPPRHGKSLLTSENFPAWYLGTNPNHRVILASYEADFAASWGRKARAILEAYGKALFDVEVSRGSSAANRWGLQGYRGGMDTAGVGGAVTGKGADLLIIDDPLKNSEEANSFTIRHKIWDWYRSTAYTRLEPDGCIVLIQTRWHSDDLAGRVIKEARRDGEDWEILNLPAIAGANDILGRSPGQALWPERFNVERLQKIRRTVGSYFWSALYDQNPTDEEGGRVKREWFRFWEILGDHYRLRRPDGEGYQAIFPVQECQRVITVDCAGSSEDVTKERQGKAPSYSVISVWDYHRGNGWLLWRDCRRGRWEFPELCHQLDEMYDLHLPEWVGIEDEKTGRALLQNRRRLPTRALSHEGKDKLARAGTFLNDFEQGKVHFPAERPPWSQTPDDDGLWWRDHAENELTSWTGGKDEPFDMGDTAAYAALHVDRSYLQGDLIIDGGPIIGGIY